MVKMKSLEKRYRVGEIAENAGVPKTTLNHWITARLLKPLGKSDGGHRLFGEEVFERIEIIQKSQKLGKSIEQIREEQDWS